MMDYNDYIFCKNYSEGYLGDANKNMDHDRYARLKSSYEKLTPQEKKKIVKNGNNRKHSA